MEDDEILNGKDMKEDIVSRLREFIENEARSCSMDFGCITLEYVYRMWGGTVPIEDIEDALTEIRQKRIPQLTDTQNKM